MSNEAGTTQTQQALEGFESQGVDVEKLPAGVSDLKPREMLFVNALLRHGNMRQAALEAGYKGEKDGAGVWASRTLRKAKVFRLYSGAVEQVSQNADKLVNRAWERSVIWHEKAKAAAQEMAEACAHLEFLEDEAGKRRADGIHDSKLHEKALKDGRERVLAAQQAERRYEAMANRADTLLGSLLGKLNLNLNLSGEVSMTAGNEFTHAFAEKRREYEASRGRN